MNTVTILNTARTKCEDSAVLEPLMNAFRGPFKDMFGDWGVSRLEMFTFEGLSQEHLQLLEGWDVPKEVFVEATKRSSRNGDVLLTHQVSVMHNVHMFIGSMAKLWSWSRTHLTDAARGTCTGAGSADQGRADCFCGIEDISVRPSRPSNPTTIRILSICSPPSC